MDIQQLRYFVEVCQTLNITKTADRLFITRQALSKSIHEFEKECGAPLFLRDKSKLQLTLAGRSILEKAIPLVDSFTEFEKSLKPDLKNKKGRVQIAIGLGSLNALSPDLFVDFKRDYPNIALSFEEIFDSEVRKKVKSREVDMGILGSSPSQITDYNYKLIQSGEIYFQVSKDSPLTAKEYLIPADLHQAALRFLRECLRYASSFYGKMP